MKNKLEIKFRHQRQSFQILDDEILVDLNTAKHKLKYSIPYDEIKNSQFISKAKHDGLSLLAYLSFILNLAFIAYLLFDFSKLNPSLQTSLLLTLSFGSVFFIKAYFSDFSEKHIESSKILYFIYTKKTAVEVDAFIETIYKKQTEFYRRKFFVIDPVLAYPIQCERYLWLYSNKYINQDEYEIIKEDLANYLNFNPSL